MWGQVGVGVCWGVLLVVRSHGRTNATRNFHFFAELGVKGTPQNSYKFRVFDSAEAAGPAAEGCVFRVGGKIKTGGI